MTERIRYPGRVQKVLLYSHDTFGLGHLRRNLRIATHLLSCASEMRIVLMSGSPVATHFPLPPGLDVIKLPSVRKAGAEQYQPLDERLTIGVVRRTRTAVMCDVVRRFRPDVLLVDHSPAGMQGELLDVFDTVRAHSPATRVVLGLRDILDEPSAVISTWERQGIYELITDVYDKVVVYGSQDVFDVGRSYRLPAMVRNELVYCGYLRPASMPAGVVPDLSSTRPSLLATVGGGGDGMAVLSAAIDAGARMGLHTVAVAGPLMDDDQYHMLENFAAGYGSVELMRFHPDVQAAMASAHLIVTMGGYNTLTEAVASGTPTVVVPRRHPRSEQAIRADLFARRGLLRVVDAGPDLGLRIEQAVANPPTTTQRAPLDFLGLHRLSAVLTSAPAASHLSVPAALVARRGTSILDERMPA